MNRLLIASLLLLLPHDGLRAGNGELLPIERDVAETVAGKQVTIVHFWASWCANCESEHARGGWLAFTTKNPEVKVIFISIRGSAANDVRMLEEYGLIGLPNFTALRHPNQARSGDEAMKTFLGHPVPWTPATWVFRSGGLRYALNYGEVRFPILQQLVDDASASW